MAWTREHHHAAPDRLRGRWPLLPRGCLQNGNPVMKRIRNYSELTGEDRSCLADQVAAQRRQVTERLAAVRHLVAVMSGKGGVGKSFLTASVATAMAEAGGAVGVLDADLHGPTSSRMLGAARAPLKVGPGGVEPATGARGVRVMSTDLLLPDCAPLRWREAAAMPYVWRGALEAGALREFLSDVAWGPLDVLLVDLPPGTEQLAALAEFVPSLRGVMVVTIPSDASLRAVERALTLAREAGTPILGIVENMAGYACASCGVVTPLFIGGAAARLAAVSGAPVLGSIPFDPAAQCATDNGRPLDAGPATAAVSRLAAALLTRMEAS